MSYNYLFKLIVLGKESVGKTCLVDAWCGRPFSSFFDSTIGVDFHAKSVYTDGLRIKNHIWDITGQQKFATIISAYYGECAGVFILFDVTNKQSFFNIDYWIQEVKKNNNNILPPTVVIGSKTDKKNRTVSYDEAQKFVEDRNLKYIETSSKKHINVEESFRLLVDEIYSNIDNNSENLPRGIRRGALRKFNKLQYNKSKKYRNCDPCTEDSWKCCLIS